MNKAGRERDKQIAELKGWIVRKHKASNLTAYPDGYYYDILHKKEGFQDAVSQAWIKWKEQSIKGGRNGNHIFDLPCTKCGKMIEVCGHREVKITHATYFYLQY